MMLLPDIDKPQFIEGAQYVVVQSEGAQDVVVQNCHASLPSSHAGPKVQPPYTLLKSTMLFGIAPEYTHTHMCNDHATSVAEMSQDLLFLEPPLSSKCWKSYM